ncbi:uncharacterized protein LOC123512789 [Portunus trituberculatus]|uniref:uncharacterized protein LOC123512789 n=1 Tax=Portunus trituberculatus TaxID=210409 RepID=UPI001E1D0029|nr:uncharacterized protein LOC123512789 [Portunus trituberculatus]XP_045125312.1 uncharacterized protein LOC123512789 [Portunus trituberculatus]
MLPNNVTGISIPVARTIYVSFIPSVIHYLSPALIQIPKSSLQPLELFQNKIMRVILGCPLSIQVANMQAEHNLPPIVDRITSIVTRLTAKCLHSPKLAPHYSQVIRRAITRAPRFPALQAGGKLLVKTVSIVLCGLDAVIPVEEDVPHSPPWLMPVPEVHFTPTSTAAHPALQRQLTLETISTVSSSFPVPCLLYSDGSLQSDGRAGCAVFSEDMDAPPEGWVGRRLLAYSSSTFCELSRLFDAVSLMCQHGLSGVVVCDSQSALQALSSTRSTLSIVVTRILSYLALGHDHSLNIKFVWIPSHIGLSHSDRVDALAKEACSLPPPAEVVAPSFSCILSRICADAAHSIDHLKDQQRIESVTIRHYDTFRFQRYKYRRRGVMVRRHNVVFARLRLGYRPVWQVAGQVDVPLFSCHLCGIPEGNSLDHYCLHCPEVDGLLPRDLSLLYICWHLLNEDHLDVLLARCPRFGGC